MIIFLSSSSINNTPIFFIRDALKFPDFIHTQKRDPKTNLRSAKVYAQKNLEMALNGLDRYVPVMEADLNLIEDLLSNNTFEEFKNGFDNIKFEPKPRKNKNITEELSPESFNFVTSINRINGEIRNDNSVSLIDRIDLSFDINSVPTKAEERFGIDEIESFLEKVTGWHDDLKSDIFSFIE